MLGPPTKVNEKVGSLSMSWGKKKCNSYKYLNSSKNHLGKSELIGDIFLAFSTQGRGTHPDGSCNKKLLAAASWNHPKTKHSMGLVYLRTFSLPKTNKSHLKMDGWNMIVAF